MPPAKSVFRWIFVVSTIVTSVQSCGPGRGIGGPRRGRKLTPLVFKEHVPNVFENTLTASGLHEGRITRDHSKFKDLVPNYNSDIIFKDEEGTGADRLMSQRCKEKLNTLAVSVMNQWPSVRLRVTEGWDEEDYHASDSLHYEGRAVDITTSDRDRSKYGMLARLAVEAGFDWVFYESRAHIHCSVKSDSSQSSHSSGCFTADSTVVTEAGVHRKMSDLQVGERVLSVDSATGSVLFSEVLLFLDRDAEEARDFVHIETESGASITATPAHLLMVWRPHTKEPPPIDSVSYHIRTTDITDIDTNVAAVNTQFLFADRVRKGDFLLVNINGTLIPERTISIQFERRQGVYAPLTAAGTIVVDSVAASCYALVDSQTIAHWSFLPMRSAKALWHWLYPPIRPPPLQLSLSTSKSTFTPLTNTNSIQRGIHWYAQALYSIKDTVLPAYLIHQ